MGLLRFVVDSEEILKDWPEVYHGYLAGPDGRIFPSRMEVEGNVLGCRRNTSESGKFHIAWPVAGHGRLLLCTGSLPERQEPYVLALELARGKIVQLRDQASQWELSGLRIPVDYYDLLKQAQAHFRQAVLEDDLSRMCEMASQAIVSACDAAKELGQAYSRQALASRQQRYPHLPAILGIELEHAAPHENWSLITSPFNSACLRLNWKEVEPQEGDYSWELTDQQSEWCESRKMVVRAGPLLDFGPGGLPGWLAPWEHDPFNLQSFICDFIETAMLRYQGRVRLWEIATRFNTGGALKLPEDQRLALLARVLDIARQVDEESQLILRVDQPWGDYMAKGQHRLSPIQTVDALVRSGVGLSGANLEIAVGYQPASTQHRDLLDFSRLIDLWGGLGIPLHVTLSCPSAGIADLETTTETGVDPRLWKNGPCESEQADWATQVMQLLIAKPAVVGVTWKHLNDATPHSLPHSGLWDVQSQPKEIFQRLKKLNS